MARVEFAPGVARDFKRFLGHMEEFEVKDSPARIAQIVQAIGILTHSPLMGRPADDGKRELVIGRGASGYVALYRFSASTDTVYVIAIRHQRESRYRRDW